jgi:RiboL-PSP-HEPN
MSQAGTTFEHSIRDAENLLTHFNSLNDKPPKPELEVLKRAGLIMAMTAWETYVEDRVLEAAAVRLAKLSDKSIAAFMQSKLDDEIKRLNNPVSEKVIALFRDYAGTDLSKNWAWPNFDRRLVCERLDAYIKLRGDVVHRSPPKAEGRRKPDPVTKDELQKTIRFLKELVRATEAAFIQTTA